MYSVREKQCALKCESHEFNIFKPKPEYKELGSIQIAFPFEFWYVELALMLNANHLPLKKKKILWFDTEKQNNNKIMPFMPLNCARMKNGRCSSRF